MTEELGEIAAAVHHLERAANRSIDREDPGGPAASDPRRRDQLTTHAVWQHAGMSDCPFCLPEVERRIVLSNADCFSMWTEETPVGSAMVLPRAHRVTIFDLTYREWVSTRRLLEQMRQLIVAAHAPDGWNVGWNVESVGGQSVPHAHCHLVPRYRDEPLAGRGVRSWIKEPCNRPPHHPPPRQPSWWTPATTGAAHRDHDL